MVKQKLLSILKPVVRPVTDTILGKHYDSTRPLTPVGPYNKVVILAPHMDDETIGAGGTIMKHVEDGAEVHCIFTSDGSGSESGHAGDELSLMRKQEMENVNRILGMDRIHYMDLPDGHVRSDEESQQALKDLLTSIGPELIYAPPYVDAHPDHTNTMYLLADVLDDTEELDPLIRLYEINCPIPPEEINCIVDISEFVSRKEEAITMFSSQVIAFDGFLKMNRLKTNLTSQETAAVETFLQVDASEFVRQAEKLSGYRSSYLASFKQMNREVTLLWAIFKNHRHKKLLYQERLF